MDTAKQHYAELNKGESGNNKSYREHMYWRFHLINSDKFNQHVQSLHSLMTFAHHMKNEISESLRGKFEEYLADIIKEYVMAINAHNSQDGGKLSQWVLTDTKEIKYGMLGESQRKTGLSGLFGGGNKEQGGPNFAGDGRQNQQQQQQQQPGF